MICTIRYKDYTRRVHFLYYYIYHSNRYTLTLESYYSVAIRAGQ